MHNTSCTQTRTLKEDLHNLLGRSMHSSKQFDIVMASLTSTCRISFIILEHPKLWRMILKYLQKHFKRLVERKFIFR